jgi:Cu2+-exporting ATPase
VRSDALETLSRVSHVVIDKTGTLTTGRVRLTGAARLGGSDEAECVALAAALEQGSAHPIARALFSDATTRRTARDVVSVAGAGVEGTVGGRRYRFGRFDWVAGLCRAPFPSAGAPRSRTESCAVLASESEWIAILHFGDTLRPDARAFVADLERMGATVSLLSGDRREVVAQAAQSTGIDDWHADATPDAKRAFVAKLQREGAVVAMIGDGVNDAPSLAQADVSLTLGSAATLTQWTADAVVLGEDLMRIAFALRAARRTFRVIRQNVGWALVYNAVAIPLAASGHLSPLAAAIGMSASSLVVVGNAWRLTAIARPQGREVAAAMPTHRDESDEGILRPDSGSLDAPLRMPPFATVH